jgi:PAS domain-containing protein
MAMTTSDKTGAEKAALVSTLSQALAGNGDFLKLARSLATTLRGSPLDWRDLARALDVARTKLPASADPQRSAQLLDRMAILAMRLTEGDVPKASAEMLEACAGETEPEQMLHKVLSILQNHIPFDVCSYAEYCHGSGTPDNPTFIQARFALDGDQQFSWPARWIAIPPELVAWAEGPKHVISDVDQFYAEQPEARALKTHVVAEEYARRGITSFLFAPCMDGGRIRAALTLGRRRNGPHQPFEDFDQQRLDAFHLEPVLRQVGEAFERRTATLTQDIAALFTPTADPVELARTAVQKLGEGYGLQYVGLFRVNRARERFEVIAQHDTHGELQVSSDYNQGLDEGMLSHVLEERRELYAANLRVTPPPYDYKAAIVAQASAICFPIRLGLGPDAEVEWILDLESSQIDAFPRPEQIALRKIVAEVERSVQLWFEARLCAALVNMVEQGVVVLGQKMRIERANVAARRLLGLPRHAKLPFSKEFADLASFAADDSTRELIRDGHASSAGAHLRLRGPDGIERRALAGSSYRDDAFNRRVWLLGDVEQHEWVGALRYMEAAVRTVSAQAHGNLRLAGALLRRVLSELDSGAPAYALVDRAIRSIATADLPYERIASVHDVIATPLRDYSVLNLTAALQQFRNALSPDDAGKVKLDLPDHLVVVKADPERLSFALRSLLGYLLALRLPEVELDISLSTSRGKARLEIVLKGAPPDAVAKLEMHPDAAASTRDEIAYAEARAVAAAGHGLEAVDAVVKAHGGQLQQEFGPDRQVRFIIGNLRLDSSERPNRRGRTDAVRSEGRTA